MIERMGSTCPLCAAKDRIASRQRRSGGSETRGDSWTDYGRKLEEIDYNGGVQVEARLSAELVNLRTGAVVWTGDAAETASVDTRDVNLVVAQMSPAIQKCLDRMVAGLAQQLPARDG